MLETAGIDISIYKSHITRAAASTAMKGLFPVEDILRTAGWSNVQTFAKFYDKPSAPFCRCLVAEYIYSARLT